MAHFPGFPLFGDQNREGWCVVVVVQVVQVTSVYKNLPHRAESEATNETVIT